MRSSLKVILSLALAAATMPLAAQLPTASEGEALIKAVRDEDGSTAATLIEAPGSRLVNYRSYEGETALLLVTKRRDLTWVKYLLGRSADPNIGDKNGDTPLIWASRIGFLEAAEYMILVGAKVDTTNRGGETALIVAVQQRQPRLVRLLLEAGADPDKSDHSAGLSAREYAKRDNRNPDILKLIETVKSTKKKAVAGPKI